MCPHLIEREDNVPRGHPDVPAHIEVGVKVDVCHVFGKRPNQRKCGMLQGEWTRPTEVSRF